MKNSCTTEGAICPDHEVLQTQEIHSSNNFIYVSMYVIIITIKDSKRLLSNKQSLKGKLLLQSLSQQFIFCF